MNYDDDGQERVRLRIKLVLGILGSIGFAFPLIAMFWFHASPLPMANESLAYRFLLCERILHGEGATAWIWQGFVTSALQTNILSLLNLFSHATPDQLEMRIRWFTFIYLSLVSGGCASTLYVAARLRTINVAGMVLLVLAADGPVFLTRVIGFYYYNLPDYLVLNVLFVVIAVLLFQHWWVKPQSDSSEGMLESMFAGLLLGFMVANKVTMIVIGAVPIAALLLRPRVKWQYLLLRGIVAAIAAVIGFLFVVLVMYRFDAYAAETVVKLLLGSVQNLSRTELGFWTVEFRTYLTGYSYGTIIGFFLAAVVIAALPIWRSERSRTPYYTMVCILVLAGGAWVYLLGKRPAGTTFFEAVIAWLSLGCMALSMIRQSLRGSLLIQLIFGATFVIADVTFSPRFGELCNGLRDSAKQDSDFWRVHRELRDFAGKSETIVIIPDNTYAYGGVPEFLLKGTADFPTWNITEHGRPTLEAYAPHMDFRSNYAGDLNNPYPAGAVLFWVDLPENTPIEQRYNFLRAFSLKSGVRSKSWIIPTAATRTLHAYAIQIPSEPTKT